MADEWRKQDTTDGGAENERYMEGNYDSRGNIVKRYKQIADDEHQSVQMAEEIRASQEAVYERETERLSYEYEATGEAFTKIMKEYIEEDMYQQYLVDGAVLRCNQATTDDFDYNGGTVVLENKADELCNIVLDVHENPISGGSASGSHMTINGQRYATVMDRLQEFNLNPPKCNCKLAADRLSEHEKIRADGDRNKNGVCKHLMRLNEEWDNYRVEGTEYLKKDDAIIELNMLEDGQVQAGTSIEHEGVEGITMTSVLFCKHGGLIMPVTSGQDRVEQERKFNTESPDFSDQEAVKEYVWNYFRNANFSEAATAAILGNIYVETGGYRPDVNDNDRYGLFQYMNERKDVFLDRVKKWAVDEGITDVDNAWKSVEMQCRFALEEIETPGDHGWLDRGIYLTINGRSFDMLCTSDKFRTEEDPSVAALMWAASFERCYSGDVIKKDGNIYFTKLQDQEKRCNEAARAYEEFTEYSNR